MMDRRNLVKSIYAILILAIAVWGAILFSPPLAAQSNQNLRSDLISLRSRISRLEQEVNRLQSFNSRVNSAPQRSPQASPAPNPTIINPPIVDGEAIRRSDPLYEQFATLLIELKEDVRSLENRLTELEKSSRDRLN